jgi:hypothetical protein
MDENLNAKHIWKLKCIRAELAACIENLSDVHATSIDGNKRIQYAREVLPLLRQDVIEIIEEVRKA